MKIKTKLVSCHTKPVKQEVNGTVILPPLVLPAPTLSEDDHEDEEDEPDSKDDDAKKAKTKSKTKGPKTSQYRGQCYNCHFGGQLTEASD